MKKCTAFILHLKFFIKCKKGLKESTGKVLHNCLILFCEHIYVYIYIYIYIYCIILCMSIYFDIDNRIDFLNQWQQYQQQQYFQQQLILLVVVQQLVLILSTQYQYQYQQSFIAVIEFLNVKNFMNENYFISCIL